MGLRLIILCIIPLITSCASLERDVKQVMAPFEADGAEFGLLVTTLDGEDLLAINPDKRFLPASTVKLVTTAAAFEFMEVYEPDAEAGASVHVVWPPALDHFGDEAPEEQLIPQAIVVLKGNGDARLSAKPECSQNCLSELVSAVRSELGDDTPFCTVAAGGRFGGFTRPSGWSWEDLPLAFAAPVTALVIDDNQTLLTIEPAHGLGEPAQLSFEHPLVGSIGGLSLMEAENEIITVDEQFDTLIHIRRAEKHGGIILKGQISVDTGAVKRRIYLASSEVIAAALLQSELDDTLLHDSYYCVLDQPIDESLPPAINQLTPPPLIEDLAIINKESNNLHAEILLRRLGLIDGDGSTASGVVKQDEILAAAGAPETGYDLHDGSGLSIYNRLSPRAVAALLVWAQQQQWGSDYRETLAIGGVDGTLQHRFTATPLEGRIFAKSGALRHTNALAGYLRANSGDTLVFAYYVNDRAAQSGSVLDEMEAVLNAVAARW